MFVGHYATSLALKSYEKRVFLGVSFLAVTALAAYLLFAIVAYWLDKKRSS